jgi:hypothetical protein
VIDRVMPTARDPQRHLEVLANMVIDVCTIRAMTMETRVAKRVVAAGGAVTL